MRGAVVNPALLSPAWEQLSQSFGRGIILNPRIVVSPCRHNNWRNFFKRSGSKLLKACLFGFGFCLLLAPNFAAFRALVRSLYLVTGAGKRKPHLFCCLFSTLFFPDSCKYFLFIGCFVSKISFYLPLLLLQGEKTRKATDGREGSCSLLGGIYSSDFQGQKIYLDKCAQRCHF